MVSRMQKITAIGIGVGGGIAVYIYNKNKEQKVLNSWTTNTVLSPGAKWDYNWDQ